MSANPSLVSSFTIGKEPCKRFNCRILSQTTNYSTWYRLTGFEHNTIEEKINETCQKLRICFAARIRPSSKCTRRRTRYARDRRPDADPSTGYYQGFGRRDRVLRS